MSEAEIKEAVQRIEQFQGEMLSRMRERGDTQRADDVEKQWKEMKKLLDSGDKAGAQKIMDEMMQSMRRR